MQLLSIYLVLFNAFGLAVVAARACLRDQCYSAIAGLDHTQRRPPSVAARKADCSSILIQIDDSQTTTSQILETATTATIWVVPTANIGLSSRRKRNEGPSTVAQPEITTSPQISSSTSDDDETPPLEPRDQYIIAPGVLPTYAQVCGNKQRYATACLCYGVQAGSTIVRTHTDITTTTIFVVATSTIDEWDIRRLQATGQAFCTSYNSYTAPTSTKTLETVFDGFLTVVRVNTTIRATPVTITRTFTTPVAVPPIRRRDKSQPSDDEDVVSESTQQTPHDDSTLKISGYASPTVEGIPHIIRRFSFPIVTPAPVLGWDAQRISAACSRVATDTSFIYKTVFTTTAYRVTMTSISTITEKTTTKTISIQDATPTFIFGNYITGSPRSYNDNADSLRVPFPIGAFGAYSNNIQVHVKGYIFLKGPAKHYWDNDRLPAYETLPDVAICGLWDNLYIYPKTPHGISYRVNGLAPNRTIIFEYRLSTYNLGHEQYHFSITFAEAQPVVVLFKYFEMYDSGYTATSGAQRLSTGKSLQYSYNQRKLPSFSYVRLDTEAGTIRSGTLASLDY